MPCSRMSLSISVMPGWVSEPEGCGLIETPGSTKVQGLPSLPTMASGSKYSGFGANDAPALCSTPWSTVRYGMLKSTVARRLAEMEALPELHTATALPLPWSSGMSGLPTEATPAGGPPPARSRDRRRGALAAAVGVALLCAAGLAGWLAWHGRRTGEAVPLLRRVLVQPPQVPAGAPDPRLALAASGVLDATLASLAGLQGIAVLDPRQLASQGTADAAPAALARSVAADEVLSASVRPAGNLARVTLRRLAGGESRLLWTSTFQVAANPDDLRLLSEAVGVHVQRGFPEHPPRPGLPVLEVRDEDYAAEGIAWID